MLSRRSPEQPAHHTPGRFSSKVWLLVQGTIPVQGVVPSQSHHRKEAVKDSMHWCHDVL